MSWAKLLEERTALASALDLVGDQWTMMIVTGCLAGYRRFNQIERHLGINRNLLKSKLDRLVAAGVLDKKPHKENSKHYAYFPTEMCYDLRSVIVGLGVWGQKHITKEDTAIKHVHADCGGQLLINMYCEKCHSPVAALDVGLHLNPGAGELATQIVEISKVI